MSLRNLRHFAAEHLTWLSLCGLVAVITGFTPEEWVAHFAEKLRVSGFVDGHWPTYLDIRAVLVAVGVGVIVTDVLLKRRAASRPLRTAETTAAHPPGTERPSAEPVGEVLHEVMQDFRLTVGSISDSATKQLAARLHALPANLPGSVRRERLRMMLEAERKRWSSRALELRAEIEGCGDAPVKVLGKVMHMSMAAQVESVQRAIGQSLDVLAAWEASGGNPDEWLPRALHEIEDILGSEGS